MLDCFWQEFLAPWLDGELDADFEKETANYWAVHVTRTASKVDAVRRVYTLDVRGSNTRVVEARLLLPERVVIVGEEDLASRYTASFGPRAKQMSRVIVADIPIDYPLTPSTWPADLGQVRQLLSSRLSGAQAARFTQSAGKKKVHCLVLLRAPTASYAFLLPGGPPTVVSKGKTKRAYPTRDLVPLSVERLDPDWTCGRDQHPQVSSRQQSHVLVLGAGALGSPVVAQLARAGVGRITVVDPDTLSGPNLGRHLLGADMLAQSKAISVELQVSRAVPSCRLKGAYESAERWLRHHTLKDVNVVLDLTGEPDVRYAVESARLEHARPLLVGWLEPYVAAAHACLLQQQDRWLGGGPDPLLTLQAVDWPLDVIQREPGCSSDFQSYTAAAATYAVGLVTEAALALVDGTVNQAHVRSWVRSQHYVNAHYPGLELREWARMPLASDGVLLQRPWP
jgi:hypothetical protein